MARNSKTKTPLDGHVPTTLSFDKAHFEILKTLSEKCKIVKLAETVATAFVHAENVFRASDNKNLYKTPIVMLTNKRVMRRKDKVIVPLLCVPNRLESLSESMGGLNGQDMTIMAFDLLGKKHKATPAPIYLCDHDEVLKPSPAFGSQQPNYKFNYQVTLQ